MAAITPRGAMMPRWDTAAKVAVAKLNRPAAVVRLVITTARPEWPTAKTMASSRESPRASRW